MTSTTSDELRKRLGPSIPVTLAAEAGVRYVSTTEAHDLGFAGFGSATLTGLAFPYLRPSEPAPVLWRLRLDHPLHDGRRYVAPINSTNRLYLPHLLAEHLSDPRFDVLITEGEKKALALRAVVGTAYLVVGVSGVWNWRTSDKERGPTRDHPGLTTRRVNSRPIADLDLITFRHRRVYLLNDSDGATNEKVRHAEQALAAELKKRGATVLVVSIPPGSAGQKLGIDDWLAQHADTDRATALKRLLAIAAPRRTLAPSAERRLDLQYEPSGGFMRTFDEAVDEMTDSPAVFRPFSALAVMGTIVGRHVGIPWHGFSHLYPNSYTALMAQSSFFHKTTQINIAKRLIGAVRDRAVLPDEFTPEKGVDLLREHPERFLGCAEFAGLLARSGKDYMGGLKEFLMEMYDCPDRYERATRGTTVTIEKPVLTVLAASATSWLSEQLRGGDLRSGFLNRFGFVLAEQKSKSYALPGSMPGGREQWPQLVTQLRRLSEIQGTAQLAPETRTVYERWYHHVEREASRHRAVEIVSAFDTRLSVTAVKYALLIELSASENLTIKPAAMEEAIVLADYLRATIRHLLATEFGHGEGDRRLTRVLTVIQKSPPGGCKRKYLLQQTGYKARDLEELLGTLIQREDIYESDGGYWPCG